MRTKERTYRAYFILCLLGLMLSGIAPCLNAQDHWVATWAASPQAASFGFARPAQGSSTPAAEPKQATQSKQPPPFMLPPDINNQTVRMIVRTSIGGRSVRVHFSNAYGTGPLTIEAARIASRDKDSSIVPDSDRALTFNGKASFVIPPGAPVVSDPVDFAVPKLGYLVISVYITGDPTPPTVHLTGLHTTYISKSGDFTQAKSIADATTTQSWYYLSSVDVLAPANAGSIVAFGDSITDGASGALLEDRQLACRLSRPHMVRV